MKVTEAVISKPITRTCLLMLAGITMLALSACAGTGKIGTFINVPTPPPIPVAVYELPGCTCCSKYFPYLEGFGFKVTSNATMDTTVREKYPVPPEMVSCHIMIIEGYFVEGHVPVGVIRELLKQKPAIDGVILPGMPPGSPGMEGKQTRPFVIYAVTAGKASEFMTLPAP